MKRSLNKDVYQCAMERLERAFSFDKTYIAFSGGKDSTVCLYMACEVARKKNKKLGLMFIDLEAQYAHTIEHVKSCIEDNKDVLEVFWCSVPLRLRNATNSIEPFWTCWDKEKESLWVRSKPTDAREHFSFHKDGMEFEDFMGCFGEWYSGGSSTSCIVGIRTEESYNRDRAVRRGFEVNVSDNVSNIYPIYDWEHNDIWLYHLETGHRYNKIYELMAMCGVEKRDMRICQPYGDTQKKGLSLFREIEPDTWSKVVQRVVGANSYVSNFGNVSINKPDGMKWKEFFYALLDYQSDREHFINVKNKYESKWLGMGYDELPDEAPKKLEAKKLAPSWRKLCLALLRNDYWGVSLGNSNTGTKGYKEYLNYIR